MKAVFPDRVFDVGIAEQHAVTFAAGLATEGYRPSAPSIRPSYSAATTTGARRGDPELPVRFALDRAGPGRRRRRDACGRVRFAYLACLPNMTVMVAADEADSSIWSRPPRPMISARSPCAIRAAKAWASTCRSMENLADRQGPDFARRLADCDPVAWDAARRALKAAEELAARGLSTTVADARFAKPLDRELILKLAAKHKLLITIEEGAAGGFGAHVLTLLSEAGALEDGLKVRIMTLRTNFRITTSRSGCTRTPGSTPRALSPRRPRRSGTSNNGSRAASHDPSPSGDEDDEPHSGGRGNIAAHDPGRGYGRAWLLGFQLHRPPAPSCRIVSIWRHDCEHAYTAGSEAAPIPDQILIWSDQRQFREVSAVAR